VRLGCGNDQGVPTYFLVPFLWVTPLAGWGGHTQPQYPGQVVDLLVPTASRRGWRGNFALLQFYLGGHSSLLIGELLARTAIDVTSHQTVGPIGVRILLIICIAWSDRAGTSVRGAGNLLGEIESFVTVNFEFAQPEGRFLA